jgi:anaerobic dimethyl sulfoxide reductase subunit A
MKKSEQTRRGFLKSATALGIAGIAPLPGMGGEAVAAVAYNPGAPLVEIPGAAPHSCGAKCVSKVHVSNGIVRYITTDDRPDRNIIDSLRPDGTYDADDPQRRACVKCRSRRQWLYRNDRLLYPLKQTKQRGDISGFVRISWEQAYREIAERMKEVAGENGKGAHGFYFHVNSGDGSTPTGNQAFRRLANMMGGHTTRRASYSDPTCEHINRFCIGADPNAMGIVVPPGNSRQDFFNTEQIVVWGQNCSETTLETNSSWYLTQARDVGKQIVVVDSRVSRTANTLGSKLIPVIPGTDAALVLGMMYHLLEKQLTEPADSTKYLDYDFIRKYVFGFFDEPEIIKTDSYRTHYKDSDENNDMTGYTVTPGASLSAYIFGRDERLVKAGLNLAASIYPNTIGYNTNKSDPLYGKYTLCYGQTPKTLEWAARITGVKASDIRWLAEEYASKKTFTLAGGGHQRHIEQEGGYWLMLLMGFITKNFGEKGRSTGTHKDQIFSGWIGFPIGSNKAEAELTKTNYDLSKLSVPDRTPKTTRVGYTAFVFADVCKNAKDSNLTTPGISDWNDGQVRHMPQVKIFFNPGGNMIMNSDPDPNAKLGWIKDRSRVETIISADFFMTSTCQYSDYVLPSAMGFERFQGGTMWQYGGEAVICMNKAVDPQGEAMQEYDMCAGIARQLGGEKMEEEYRGGLGKTAEDWVRQGFEALKPPITFEEWKKTGIYTTTDPRKPPFIALEAYRNNPSENPMFTPTGKLEAYSMTIMEDYEARFYDNIDRNSTLLANNGTIYTRGTVENDRGRARFVYPIPMYIAMLEGMHADGSHPDPLKFSKKYPYLINDWHYMWRSHSSLNSNAYLNEIYKRDIRGAPAYLSPERPLGAVWEDGIYEPCCINPQDAVKIGVVTGDRVLLYNDRGKIYASAVVTGQMRPGCLGMAHGGWFCPNEEGIDVGGSLNTLYSNRPSRICQGSTVGSNVRVAIKKA